MMAWVLHRINDIRYEETVTSEVSNTGASGDEVLVNVRAAGICGSDIPRIYETGAHRMPLILGHEFAGEVVAVGEGVDTGWIGKRVGVYPLIPCRKCHSCLQDQYELCRDYDYIGSRRDGAFAEYVRVPMDNLIEIPDAVTYEAAAMLEPMAVAVHAMRIGLRGLTENKGIPIAVCGLGTIGLGVVSFLLDAGFSNLYLLGNKDRQIEAATSLLEEYKSNVHICDIRSDNPFGWIVEQCLGVAVFFDCVGSVESLDYGLKGLLPGGRMITVGNPHGDMNLPRDSYWQILRKQLTLLGTWNSSFFPGRYHGSDEDIEMDRWISPREKPDDWHYVLDRLAKGCVRPEMLITHRMNMDELDKGLIMMRDKTEEYIKVMAIQE